METSEIEQAARHRAPEDGLSTMEMVALARVNGRPTQRLATLLPDPDSGAGWALQLAATVFIGSLVCGLFMVGMVMSLNYWFGVAP